MLSFSRESQNSELSTRKTKANVTLIFPAILRLIKIIFIGRHSAKKKNFHQVFHQRCLQKISKNLQITPDLCAFTKEILDGKIQNIQNFT